MAPQDLKQVHNTIQDLRAILQALRTIIQALRAILRALRVILRALRVILRALRVILRALRVILQAHRVMSLLALRTTNIPVELMEQHMEPLTVKELINVVQDEDLPANLKEKVAGVVHIPLNPALNLNLKEKVVGVVDPAHKAPLPSHPVPLQLAKLQEVKATKTTEAKVKQLEKVAGVDHMEATPKLESAFELVGLRERRKDKNDAHDELLVTVRGAIKALGKGSRCFSICTLGM